MINRDKKLSESPTERKRYLRIVQIRLFEQVIIGTTLSLFIIIVLITSINFSHLIFWPDILLSIMLWVFLLFIFAYCFADDPINLNKPGIILFGNIFFAMMIYIMALVPYSNYLNVLPIAYIIYMILFVSLCIGGIITLITNIYVVIFWKKYRETKPELFKISQYHKIRTNLNGIFIIFIIILLGLVILTIYLPDIVIYYFPIAYEISIVVFIILCVLGAIIIILNIFILYKRRKGEKRSHKYNKKKTIIALGLIITSLPLLIFSIPGVMRIPVTIEPKNYQVEFAIFLGYGNVSSSRGQNLNDHHVTLVFCCFPDIFDAEGKQEFVNTYTHYNNTYPNIDIFLTIDGDPGNFIWDGNAEDTIYQSKLFISLAKEYNLTNIKGLTIDIEAPQLDSDFDHTPNQERHNTASQLWQEFFNWRDINAPDIEFSAVYWPEIAVDLFDEDYDIHYIHRLLALDMVSDGWDEHAPMIYRSAFYKLPPYGEYTDGGLYFTYNRLNIVAQALDKKYGNYDNLGVWLDFEKAGCYTNTTCSYEGFVKDSLIAKHFGVSKISLFMMGPHPLYGGIFDYYGDDFLDRFNESVNGAGSNTPFQIWYEPKVAFMLTYGIMDPFFNDIFANINSLLGAIFITLLFAMNTIFANYRWKKIKLRVLSD